MKNITHLTNPLGLLTAIVKFGAETMRTFWTISEVAVDPQARMAAEMITYLSVGLGVASIGLGAISGGGAGLIAAVIFLSMIVGMIQSFAVSIAAGCTPIPRNG